VLFRSERGWLQVCLFGEHEPDELELLERALRRATRATSRVADPTV
jgi:hypothetical protein